MVGWAKVFFVDELVGFTFHLNQGALWGERKRHVGHGKTSL
jgi:hypothetical protein